MENQREFPRRGKLKIFFGYAAGTGKTWAMLEAGRQAAAAGVDTVIGYLEPHDRPETAARAQGLESVEPRILENRGLTLREMDLDAVIERMPQLALVDELAHTNAPGSRHAKRSRDVQELLAHGIDVYTTLNVQHLESLHDQVASLTGVLVRERVPDDVFDLADQIELVDIEVPDLLERLAAGKIYPSSRIRQAQEHFFRTENLMALREIALRRCADRLSRIQSVDKARPSLLVCLSPSPSNARLVRQAARMAQAFDARFFALYIAHPAADAMSDEDQARLQEHIRLASRLGAQIETASGEDIARQIGIFARTAHIDQIVIGRPGARSAFRSRPFVETLSALAPDAQLLIMPDAQAENASKQMQKRRRRRWTVPGWKSLLIQAGVLALTCLVAAIAHSTGFSQGNILAIFIFSTLACALCAETLWQSAAAWLVNVILFTWWFARPIGSFRIFDQGVPAVFAAMLAMALIITALSRKTRQDAALSARSAARSSLLYQASSHLQTLQSADDIARWAVQEVSEVLDRPCVFYSNDQGKAASAMYAGAADPFLDSKEYAVAQWTLTNNRRAGASTETLGSARGLYLAVRHNGEVFGVLGIDIDARALTVEEDALTLSLLGISALALKNIQSIQENEQAQLKARQQELKTSLLRSVSHDLRTPLTTIAASADLLARPGLNSRQSARLAGSIQSEAQWLKETVENLLSLSRLDEVDTQLCRQWVSMEEAVSQAIRHAGIDCREHPVSVDISDDCAAPLDGRLIVQMLVNLLTNCARHTPPQTHVTIRGRRENNCLKVSVFDDGPGIDPSIVDHLFEPFTLRKATIADSSRSMGLGLSLVAAIAAVHGGQVSCRNLHPGACFDIVLPVLEDDEQTTDSECGRRPADEQSAAHSV